MVQDKAKRADLETVRWDKMENILIINFVTMTHHIRSS